jgi:hypothetical protein
MILLVLVGCSTPTTGPNGEIVEARDLLDRIEFDENEYGCADIRGEVALSPIPMIGSKVNVVIKKVRPAPDGQETPEC